MNVVLYLAVLAMAVSAFSVTATKSVVTKPLRQWLTIHWPFAGKLMSCPYCLSHWVAFILAPMAGIRLLEWWLPNLLVVVFAIVAMAALCSAVITRGFLIYDEEIATLKEDLADARAVITDLLNPELH